jgi:hypothetical protein
MDKQGGDKSKPILGSPMWWYQDRTVAANGDLLLAPPRRFGQKVSARAAVIGPRQYLCALRILFGTCFPDWNVASHYYDEQTPVGINKVTVHS